MSYEYTRHGCGPSDTHAALSTDDDGINSIHLQQPVTPHTIYRGNTNSVVIYGLLSTRLAAWPVFRRSSHERTLSPVSTGMGDRLREGIYTLSVYVTKPTGSTQPCIPRGRSSGRGKDGNVSSAGWPVTVTLCDPIWHVSSRV